MSFGHRDQTPSGALLTRLILSSFRLHGALLRAGDELGRDLGVSNARWQVLAAIEAEPLPVAQIARDMGLRRQGVQPTVNALETDGLVEFRENPNHQRAKLVALTKRGRSVLGELMARQAAWVNQLAVGATKRELADAASLVEVVWQRLVVQERR